MVRGEGVGSAHADLFPHGNMYLGDPPPGLSFRHLPWLHGPLCSRHMLQGELPGLLALSPVLVHMSGSSLNVGRTTPSTGVGPSLWVPPLSAPLILQLLVSGCYSSRYITPT